MAESFGQIARRVVATLFRPERDTVQLIVGGPNAPHLACRPRDVRAEEIGERDTWASTASAASTSTAGW